MSNARIFFSFENRVNELTGQHFKKMGPEKSFTDGGKAQYFEGGVAVYWHQNTGAWILRDPIWSTYRLDHGEVTGELGYPVTDVLSGPDGSSSRYVYFQHGILKYAPEDNEWELIPGVQYVDLRKRRYNQVRQLSAHNAFEYESMQDGKQTKDKSLFNQLIYHRIRSLEFDVHKGSDGTWDIYHVTRGASCDPLRKCLEVLRRFHLMNPKHEVVTVWLDIKDDWSYSLTKKHGPNNMDDLLKHPSFLGNYIFTPKDMKKYCWPDLTSDEVWNKTLVESIDNGQWPTLKELRGKFIFVLTGGESFLEGTGEVLKYYHGRLSQKGNTNAFTAPKIKNINEIREQDLLHKNSIIYNINIDGEPEIAWQLWYQNFVTRSFLIGNQANWNDARSRYTHHLVTNNIDIHELFEPETVGINLYPFEPFAEQPTADEGGWGITDDSYTDHELSDFILTEIPTPYFLFLESKVPEQINTWEWIEFRAGVVGRGRRGQLSPIAEGGIMARTSLEKDSAYLAVYRSPQGNRIITKKRYPNGTEPPIEYADLGSQGVNASPHSDITDSMNAETPMFLKLVIKNDFTGNQQTQIVQAWASALNKGTNDWIYIDGISLRGDYCFKHLGLYSKYGGNSGLERYMYQDVYVAMTSSTEVDGKKLTRVENFQEHDLSDEVDPNRTTCSPAKVIDNYTENERETGTGRAARSSRKIVNKNSKEIHQPSCTWAKKILPVNRMNVDGPEKLEELFRKGYDGCYYCMSNKHTK